MIGEERLVDSSSKWISITVSPWFIKEMLDCKIIFTISCWKLHIKQILESSLPARVGDILFFPVIVSLKR